MGGREGERDKALREREGQGGGEEGMEGERDARERERVGGRGGESRTRQ